MGKTNDMKPPKDAGALQVPAKQGETDNESLARVAVSPVAKTSITVREFSKSFGDIDINKTAEHLMASVAQAKENNLSEAVEHLMAQAVALDSIFHTLAVRANRSEYLNNLKTYMTFALKAQNQSRMTLETLAEILNPKPYIQHNKAQYQQVNNGPRPSGRSLESNTRAREISKMTNGLLEDHHGEWLDTGAASTAGGTDKELATVEAQHGAENG
jgi:hypothetical protein